MDDEILASTRPINANAGQVWIIILGGTTDHCKPLQTRLWSGPVHLDTYALCLAREWFLNHIFRAPRTGETLFCSAATSYGTIWFSDQKQETAQVPCLVEILILHLGSKDGT